MSDIKKDFIDILASATPKELNELIITQGKYKKVSMCYIIRKDLEDGKKEVGNTESSGKHS